MAKVYCIECTFLRRRPGFECLANPVRHEVDGDAITPPKVIWLNSDPYKKNTDNNCPDHDAKVITIPDLTPPGKEKMEKKDK